MYKKLAFSLVGIVAVVATAAVALWRLAPDVEPGKSVPSHSIGVGSVVAFPYGQSGSDASKSEQPPAVTSATALRISGAEPSGPGARSWTIRQVPVSGQTALDLHSQLKSRPISLGDSPRVAELVEMLSRDCVRYAAVRSMLKEVKGVQSSETFDSASSIVEDTRRQCAGVVPETYQDAQEWMETLASLGDARAMLKLVGPENLSAFIQSKIRNEKPTAEQVAAFHARQREVLDRLAGAGNYDALVALSVHYRNANAGPVDLVLADAYLLAAAYSRNDRRGIERAERAIEQRYQDSAVRARIQGRAAEIARWCCS